MLQGCTVDGGQHLPGDSSPWGCMILAPQLSSPVPRVPYLVPTLPPVPGQALWEREEG